jgi:hypothetical protein
LFAAGDLSKFCPCVSDAQKDPAVWATLNAADATSTRAEKVNWNQFAADCKIANGGLTVSPSFLFAATAAGLAMFGARARFA